jgi:hypothetical protein
LLLASHSEEKVHFYDATKSECVTEDVPKFSEDESPGPSTLVDVPALPDSGAQPETSTAGLSPGSPDGDGVLYVGGGPGYGLLKPEPSSLEDNTLDNNKVYLLDISESSLHERAPLTQGRTGHGVSALNDGTVVATGGIKSIEAGRDEAIRSVEIYDPATDTWTRAAPMLVPRVAHSQITLADGRVLVVGGTERRAGPSSGYRPEPHAEIYDPASNTWTPTSEVPLDVRGNRTRSADPIVMLEDERVMVVGSKLPDQRSTDPAGLPLHGDEHTAAAIYDPHDGPQGSWEATGELEYDRSDEYKATAAVIRNNGPGDCSPWCGAVLVTGGGLYAEKLESAELYLPNSNLPMIDKMEPKERQTGAHREPVTLTGSRLDQVSKVVFRNSKDKQIASRNCDPARCREEEIVVDSPPREHAEAGPVTVEVVAAGGDTSSVQLNYVLPEPQVDRIAPHCGKKGDRVVLQGQDFVPENTDAGDNDKQVRVAFGEVPAQNYRVTATAITVDSIPAGEGEVDVVVDNSQGMPGGGKDAVAFRYPCESSEDNEDPEEVDPGPEDPQVPDQVPDPGPPQPEAPEVQVLDPAGNPGGDPGGQPGGDPGGQPNGEPAPQVQPDPQGQPEPDPGAQPQPDPQGQPEPDPGAQPQPDPQGQPEPDPAGEPAGEGEPVEPSGGVQLAGESSQAGSPEVSALRAPVAAETGGPEAAGDAGASAGSETTPGVGARGEAAQTEGAGEPPRNEQSEEQPGGATRHAMVSQEAEGPDYAGAAAALAGLGLLGFIGACAMAERPRRHPHDRPAAQRANR